MMKLHYKPNKLENPNKAFDIFSGKVTKSAWKKKQIDPHTFSDELYNIGDLFEKQNKKSEINRPAKKLAETLVALGNNNLAGIIYSFLIKCNQNDTKFVEEIATNALAIAKRLKDPVHIMARSHDLKEIYRITDYGSPKHLKILYDERRALNEICTNYKNTKQQYNTLSRGMKPIETYQTMLAIVRVEIAEIIKTKEPKSAIQELKAAREVLLKSRNEKYLKKIERYLSELEK